MQNLQNNIIKNVKKLLKQRDMSQRDLSIHSDISDSQLCKIMTGKQQVSVELLFTWAEYFGISMDDLIADPEADTKLPVEKNDREQIVEAIMSFMRAKSNLKAIDRKGITDKIVSLLEQICLCENSKK